MARVSGLAVLGASGHAKVVVDTLRRAGVHRIAGVFDDDPAKHGTNVLGHEVVGSIDDYIANWKARCPEAIIGIGSNRVRHWLKTRLLERGFSLATAVHPTAVIGEDVRLEEGSVVMANAVINPGCRIGPCAVINTSASVDHDSILGDAVFVAPGARLAGNVRVGDLSLIGIGASVIPGCTVGRNVIIGAGAVVIDDVPDDVTVVGVPARVIRRKP